MKDSSQFGMNKTPSTIRPNKTAKMVKGNEEFPAQNEDTSTDMFNLKRDYIQNSGPLGTVPMPTTFRGALSSGLQAMKGQHPSILIDKLGERLAYERSGVRLYDAYIMKCQAALPELDVKVLQHFRQEEAEHFAMIRDCLTAIGADPTAQTPCANASAVMSMGLMQLINDPRSTVPQCTEAILTAELTDVAAWDLLIQLVQEAGLEEFVQKFEKAKVSEDIHLDTIKKWLADMTLHNGSAPIPNPV